MAIQPHLISRIPRERDGVEGDLPNPVLYYLPYLGNQLDFVMAIITPETKNLYRPSSSVLKINPSSILPTSGSFTGSPVLSTKERTGHAGCSAFSSAGGCHS